MQWFAGVYILAFLLSSLFIKSTFLYLSLFCGISKIYHQANRATVETLEPFHTTPFQTTGYINIFKRLSFISGFQVTEYCITIKTISKRVFLTRTCYPDLEVWLN